MAIYKAISSGDASTLAIWETWNGSAWVAASVLPSINDDVYTNNNIVTITTSQSYNSLNRSSLSSPVIAQGGQFQITGANEITLEGLVNGSNANLSGDNPVNACVNRLATHTNKFHRIGDDIGGSGIQCNAFWNGSAHNIELLGNQIGGNGTNAYGFFNNAMCTFESIIGNQTGVGLRAYGFLNLSASTFNSIVGNQTGGSASTAYGFWNAALSTFNSIIGNQTGGSNATAYGFYNNVTSTFESIIGNQTGGAAYGFYNIATNSNIKIKGIATASRVAAIVNTQASSYIYFEGSVINNLGVMAIFSPTIYLNVNPDSVWKWSNLIGEDQFLYGAGYQLGNPLSRDVRKDTNFGGNLELIGTLAVPPSESVVKNVPVDDTVGTWAFDDDLILRLKKCATTEEVDSTAAAYIT